MRLSVSARILLGFLIVLFTFGAVSALTLFRLQGIGARLDLITNGYLKLALTLNELETLQSSLSHFLERLDDDGRTLDGRNLITASRRARLRSLKRADELAEDASKLNVAGGEQSYLRALRGDLARLRVDLEGLDPLYARLIPETQTRKVPTFVDEALARTAKVRLLRREALARQQIRAVAFDLRRRVVRASVLARDDQREARGSTILLVAVAVVVGALVTVAAHLTVRPLKKLRDGARKLARGDWSQRVNVSGKDEIAGLAREFNAMAAALEEREQRVIRSERLAAIGQIAAQITHEIRNPLSSIGLNAEILEEELAAGGEDNADAVAAVRAIQREVDRLTGITEEYLQMARMPKPRLELEDLGALVEDDLAFHREALAQKGVTLDVKIDPAVPRVMADENQIRQALRNLVRNATEAMAPSGGGKLSVAVGVNAGQVELRVTDTGPGMTPETQRRIFEPFFTTKEKGTGLGLALTHQIVIEHGGAIAVESTPGRGTSFAVKLPPHAEPSPA